MTVPLKTGRFALTSTIRTTEKNAFRIAFITILQIDITIQ